MAIVTITLDDDKESGLGVQVESDPPFPGPAASDQSCTTAQYVGLVLMQQIQKIASGELTLSNDEE